ncbi:hypothetical protein PAECIP111893_00801 [Paenibacillus plantiphilus]|uniref:DUF2515 domain-containing protein n=1 Tax=Paenibacillus plantiphilus TaxID=2905650 RepID=A0ABM9BXP1_9BACL|nr:DUF2515 family protein [Paenibacillus plantiphilus]CAH1196052.1 hypothetical protein PAECIP111893_00801 [Paenibacillus plantiphilus]
MHNQHVSATSGMKKVLAIIVKLPSIIMKRIAAKLRARSSSDQLAIDARPLLLPSDRIRELEEEWIALREPLAGREWDDDERQIIERILTETSEANRNNVTRTEAYRSIYFRNNELHWALLAHVVSRNGGWNMTDLKGDLLPRLLSEEQRRDTFELLERANFFIFQDAYPQLLLYETGRKIGRSLTHLLPAFGVSRFMMPVWKQFWRYNNSAVLTTALIVNEQHYIEGRIVQNSHFRKHVLNKVVFNMQIPLQTNAVIMPYRSQLTGGMKLAGLVLENFSSLVERIEFGKRLYAILFRIEVVHEGVLHFVRAVPHSGSRADYAPQLFTKEKPEQKEESYKERLNECRLIAGAEALYSPPLRVAWKDQPIEARLQAQGVLLQEDIRTTSATVSTDWFNDGVEVCRYMKELPIPRIFEITDEHCLGLNKLELAVLAAQKAGIRPE